MTAADLFSTVSLSLSAFAVLLGFGSLPLLFNSIGNLETELEQGMADYRLFTNRIWDDLMEKRTPLSQRIRRQEGNRIQYSGMEKIASISNNN